MEWYHRLQFISAVAMPEDLAAAYGTTVNGMWAAPELRSQRMIEEAHARGYRVLFSVPLIALTPKVYHVPEHQYLIDEACRDIDGGPSLVPWYYWESEPVYSICFYSLPFRRYLLERCKAGIESGMDVVNLDEINTSLGLMNREAGGSGFCSECLRRFRNHIRHETAGLPQGLSVELVEVDAKTLRLRLRDDDALYQQYRRFHELEAFNVAVDFIRELRQFAQTRNPHFAITANLAYLGNMVPDHGDLWGPMWGEQVDFVMMENIYQLERGGEHLLLPRGKFTAWYRLASSFSSKAPAWICPSIMVPKQMAGEKRIQYYLLMFVEAYANGGRWGYYWWPGVDVETRLKATAPEKLKDYIRFFRQHQIYFEQVTTQNELAILYLNSGMRKRPESHFKYLALAQAMSEAGYQYDVIYGGDGVYSSDTLDLQQLAQYKALLIPEAGNITDAQADALTQYVANHGSELILFTQNQEKHFLALGKAQDEAILFRFWREYKDQNRQAIIVCVSRHTSARILTSNPLVNVIRYAKDDEQILHFLNYQYDAIQDQVSSIENLHVRLPWGDSKLPELRWSSLDDELRLPCRHEGSELLFEIPKLNLYGLAILK